MCSRAYRKGFVKVVGKSVDVVNHDRTGKAVWNNFATIEKHSWWKERADAVPVDILIDSFVEGKVELCVPGGKVAALGLKRNVLVQGRLVGKAKCVKMLTREARTPFEAKIHDRMPVVIVDGDIYIFSEKDVISGPVQKELF